MTRRETVFGCVVAAALIAAVTLFGPKDGPEQGLGGASRTEEARREEAARRAASERPAAAKPVDPIDAGDRRGENVRPLGPASRPRESAAPRPPAPAETRVRVVDPSGRGVDGVAVVATDRSFDDPSRRVVAGPVETDEKGLALLPRPATDSGAFFVYAATIGTDAHGAAVGADARDEVRVVVPERGVLDVFVVDEDDRPIEGETHVDLLIAPGEPRSSAESVGAASQIARRGATRFEHVEAGTLLLIEARSSRADLRARPVVIEGPAGEGGVAKATLRMTPREAASARVRNFGPADGPKPAGPPPDPKPGEARVFLRHDAILDHISWPAFLEVAFSREGAPTVRARADDKGVVKVALSAGTWSVARTIWRARPFAWSAVDVVEENATTITVVAGKDLDLERPVSVFALAIAETELLSN